MHLIIFGRDAELAKIEFSSLVDSLGIELEVAFEKENYQVVSFTKEVDARKLIDRLGGTIRIAEFIAAGEKITPEHIEKLGFYFEDNFNYSISGLNCSENDLDEIRQLIKSAQKKYKLRGVEKKHDDWIATPANYSSWKLDQGFELFVLKENGNFYLARTIVSSEPDLFTKLDNDRPTREFTRGTSFRLARMMVNCLGLEPGMKIVDPFCGTGTFLIEGLFAGLDGVGIDNESRMIEASKRNINWAKKKFNLRNNAELIHSDAQSAKFKADACVFEPYMGPFMEKLPSMEKAKKVSLELASLYDASFSNVAKNLSVGAPVVCIIPYFETYDGKIVEVDTKFFAKNKFQPTHERVDYDRPDKARIRRRIYFLEKK